MENKKNGFLPIKHVAFCILNPEVIPLHVSIGIHVCAKI